MKKPSNPKERNLIKGAIRRVFSRSDIRRLVIDSSIVQHSDPTRKKVKFWVKCAECGKLEAKSNVQVDHKEPVVPVNKSLEDMTWDELIDRQWCDRSNLQCVCKPCHKIKTKAENKERRRIKSEKI